MTRHFAKFDCILLNHDMITKEKLIQAIQQLPDSFSLDDVIDRIILLQKIEIALGQVRTGDVHTEEEAKKRLEKWLPK